MTAVLGVTLPVLIEREVEVGCLPFGLVLAEVVAFHLITPPCLVTNKPEPMWRAANRIMLY